MLDDARDDSPTVHLARTLAHLTPERAAQLTDRVEALVDELSEPEAPGATRYAVLMVAHPMSPEEADDDE